MANSIMTSIKIINEAEGTTDPNEKVSNSVFKKSR